MMPSTFSLRFLSITSGAMFILLLWSFIAAFIEGFDIGNNLKYIVSTVLNIAGMLVTGIFLEIVRRKKTDLAKTFALIVILLQAGSILLKMYGLGAILFDTNFHAGKLFVQNLVLQLSYFFLPVGIMLTGISYYSTGKLFGFSNRILLIFAAVGALIGWSSFVVLCFWTYTRDLNYLSNLSLVNQLYYLADFLFNSAILVFVFSNTRTAIQPPEPENNPDILDANAVIFPERQHTSTTTTVWWMGKYLVLSIPVVNYIFLIIWSGKQQIPMVRHWAVAQYMVSCLGIVLAAFLLYQGEDVESANSVVLIFIPLIAIIIGIVLLTRADQPQPISDNSPGIVVWLGRIFLAAIPLIGWIFLIVLASDSSDKDRQNWAKAQLLLIVVSVIIYVNYLSFLDQIDEFVFFEF